MCVFGLGRARSGGWPLAQGWEDWKESVLVPPARSSSLHPDQMCRGVSFVLRPWARAAPPEFILPKPEARLFKPHTFIYVKFNRVFWWKSFSKLMSDLLPSRRLMNFSERTQSAELSPPADPEAGHKHEVRAKKARLAAFRLSIKDVPHHGHMTGTCMGHRNLRKSLSIQ